jgi:hypothetical protein
VARWWSTPATARHRLAVPDVRRSRVGESQLTSSRLSGSLSGSAPSTSPPRGKCFFKVAIPVLAGTPSPCTAAPLTVRSKTWTPVSSTLRCSSDRQRVLRAASIREGTHQIRVAVVHKPQGVGHATSIVIVLWAQTDHAQPADHGIGCTPLRLIQLGERSGRPRQDRIFTAAARSFRVLQSTPPLAVMWN